MFSLEPALIASFVFNQKFRHVIPKSVEEKSTMAACETKLCASEA
jgi:hypothetical protein